MSQLLTEMGEAVRRIADLAGPSVVGLGRGWGRGSGVIVDPGRILTNAHVLRGADVVVSLGGDAVEGRVIGVDVDLDLAVIAADTGDRPTVTWEPEAAATAGIGTPVVALADPGGRGLRATFGMVSAAGRSFRGPRGRHISGTIEHTAALPRGSSGGPLVDLEGRLLGLNTVRLEGGLILALPADAALRTRAGVLGRGEAPARPRLGVALARARGGGLLVRAVLDGSPAAEAGIRRGDVLLAAAGRPLQSVDDLLDVLQTADPPLELRVARGDGESLHLVKSWR
jgi:S1-C subfamily serine protease